MSSFSTNDANTQSSKRTDLANIGKRGRVDGTNEQGEGSEHPFGQELNSVFNDLMDDADDAGAVAIVPPDDVAMAQAFSAATFDVIDFDDASGSVTKNGKSDNKRSPFQLSMIERSTLLERNPSTLTPAQEEARARLQMLLSLRTSGNLKEIKRRGLDD